MSKIPETLPSRNEAWGFYGTIELAGHDAAQAWNAVFQMIACATDGGAEGVRDFLDSRWGRHFADTVVDRMAVGLPLEEAIETAIETHQRWRIGRQTEREQGIPRDLPFVTGWVAHFGIMDELDA